MLSFQEIGFRYTGAEEPALVDVSFAVEPGAYVVLLGANGSGKSTLARLANALLLPDTGHVEVDGLRADERATLRTVRGLVGVVAQDPDNQIISATVLDDAAFGPENLGLPRDEITRRCAEALATVGLLGFEERDPNTLSGGEKQRLVIAGVLAMDPSYLVLDEPTSMLDSEGRAEVLAAINALRARGHGILHITHDLDYAHDADKLLVLQAGRLVFEGAPDTLLQDEEKLIAYALQVGSGDVTPRQSPCQPRPLAPPDPSLPSLLLRDVAYTYSAGASFAHDALKGADLTVAAGSYTLISGHTGSGKSTLLRIAAGLLVPTSGTTGFSDGSAVTPGTVGIVFQHPEVQLFAQTVGEDILFGPRNLKMDTTGIVDSVLAAVGLEPRRFAQRSPFTLSGGEMRRVAIASILAMRSRFLLLDEPTAGLDAQGRAFVHRLIDELVRQGTGVVVVSHDLSEFVSRAHVHLLLQKGRLYVAGGGAGAGSTAKAGGSAVSATGHLHVAGGA
ncbi:MAG: ATP-binding cassette domain-containing protein [Coriobacteriales bacterium]|jgi:energy-coupling factor transport system ATP-binding protein|nr:ATP-binding cassette domain-containing protein [Coriobacteriales bacterium]